MLEGICLICNKLQMTWPGTTFLI